MLFDARKLKKNLTVFFKLLNVGGHDAELVDTGAQNVCRRADAVFDLLTQSRADGFFRVAALDLILEKNCQVALRVESLILGDEEVDIVVRAGCLGNAVGGCDGAFEVGIAFAVGHGTQNVGHRNLKRHVHAAFEVEAEAYAEFLNFVESVAEPNLVVGDILEIFALGKSVGVFVAAFLGGLFLSILLSFALIVVSHKSKREIEKADEDQEDGYDASHPATHVSFALHCGLGYVNDG